MAFTKEFLVGLNIPDEAANAIFAERGKEITAEQEKYAKLNADYEATKASLEALKTEKETLSKMAGDVDGYKKQLEKYEKAEKQRAEAAEKAAEDADLTTKILTAIGDKKFANDYAKDGVIAAVKSRLKEDRLTGIDKILEEVTKDKVGIFAGGDAGIKIPSVGATSEPSKGEDLLRARMGLPPLKKD